MAMTALATAATNGDSEAEAPIKAKVDQPAAEKTSKQGTERGYDNPMFNVTPPACCISVTPQHPLQDLTYGVDNPLYQEEGNAKGGDEREGSSADVAVETIIQLGEDDPAPEGESSNLVEVKDQEAAAEPAQEEAATEQLVGAEHEQREAHGNGTDGDSSAYIKKDDKASTLLVDVEVQLEVTPPVTKTSPAAEEELAQRMMGSLPKDEVQTEKKTLEDSFIADLNQDQRPSTPETGAHDVEDSVMQQRTESNTGREAKSEPEDAIDETAKQDESFRTDVTSTDR
jgi:hypothetical protein